MALVAISSTSRALELERRACPSAGPWGTHQGVNWGVSNKDWDSGKGPVSPAVVAHGLLSVMRREQRL